MEKKWQEFVKYILIKTQIYIFPIEKKNWEIKI